MPVISVTLLPGYPEEAQHRLVQSLANTARSVIDASDAGTTVFIQEVSTYRRDGRVFDQGGAVLPNASQLIAQFLEAMSARDLPRAQSHLRADFQMSFPGGQSMTQLTELMAWAASRYRSIAKTNMVFEESWQGDKTVVFCHGLLSGEWPDGTAFQGIRFVDRFEVVKGLIARQDVWNDLAELRPQV
jgi:phenylpyruvate tautomerase PptA (4-oxalocrotonate tautomerase family)